MRRRSIVGILIGAAILLFVVSKLLNLYTDWVWFDSVGYGSIFVTTLLYRVAAAAVTGILVFLILYLNLTVARRLLARSKHSLQGLEQDNIEYLRREATLTDYVLDFVSSRHAAMIVLLASLVIAVFSGLTGSAYWLRFAQYIKGVSFGMADPIFGKDAGYYVFRLPLYLFLYNIAVSMLFLTTIAVAALYYLVGLFQHVQAHPGTKRTFASAIAHLSVIGAITLIVKGIGYKLDADQLMYSPRGVAFGASFTDIYASRPIFYILLVMSLAGAALFLLNTRLKRIKLLIIVPAVLLVFSLAIGNLYPAIIQQFVVTPNELEKERPYIENNIRFTRMAYGLSEIQERSFAATTDLTLKDLEENAATIDNIRIHDLRPLLDTYNQIQTIRPYYQFLDVDVDRYRIDGRVRQVMLSPRELNIDKLDATAKTWINLHLKYTHGQGAVVSPVYRVSPQGLPTFFVSQIPPQSTIDDIAIEEPDIYFGEMTNHYIITNTKAPEIDYTNAQEPITTFYQGADGIKLTFVNKLLYSIRLGTLKLFLNDDITADSKLLLYRNILTRVQRIAPFLSYDEDPYLVISEGKLYWIIDAYTTSSFFPYSEPYRPGLNYIKNSVKVVIDAYNGTTTFYLFDKEEPMAQTLQSIFPTLFKDFASMPEDLKAHIRYPLALFRIQSQMLLHYHMTDAGTFFSKEDAWRFAQEIYIADEVQVQPNYLVTRLPGEEDAEFVLMLPFTPAQRNNLVAWLAARMDGEHFGELILYEFPRQKFINGTLTIENRIDQDPVISSQLTLWSQQGSRVIRGNLLVIPVESSLLYVEPIYLQASTQGLPELKRIVVAFGDDIVMETTLERALQRIFGEAEEPGEPTTPIDETATLIELADRAQQVYQQMIQAQREGRWADYGTLLAELEQIINRMATMNTPETPAPDNPDQP